MKPRVATAILILAVAACRAGTTTSSAPVRFDNAEGQPVAAPAQPASRIVSTMQSATEWIVLLGASDRLVARTDYDHEPAIAALPSIGGGLDPSAEAVAALKPDLVIGWRNSSSGNLEQALKPFHIPVYSFETTDTADIFLNLRRVGVIIGELPRADSAADALRTRLAAVHSACHDSTPPTVFVDISDDPPMTVGGGTWLGTLVEIACLRNVFADMNIPWPQVSLEAITARNPDWILTSAGAPGARLAAFRARPGWRDLRAVRAGHVIEIPADLLARGGPSIADAAAAIVAARRLLEGH